MTIIIEHNLETNTQVSREMTEQEQAYLDAFTKNINEKKQATAEAAAKKAAAEAKLAALGLDADDLKALGL